MSDQDRFAKEMEAWLLSERADEASEYASRGRKHQHLSDDELVSAWVLAFRELAANFQDGARRSAECDLRSELLLRNKEPPYGLVKDDVARLTTSAADAIEKLQAEDPGHFDKVNKEITEDMAAFRARNKN